MDVTSIHLTDPDDLTPEEKHKLERLKTADQTTMDAFVNGVINRPAESDQLLIRHPDLIERVDLTLERLILRATRALQRADKATRPQINLQIQRYQALRRDVRPYLNLALAEAAKSTPRARAERILGKVLYPQLREVMDDLESGLSEAQATERLKARLGMN